MIDVALFTLTAFLVGLSGAIAPGPMLTVTISDSMQKGFLSGPLIVSGHMLVELAIVLLIMTGLGGVIGSPLAAFIIGLVGGIVLMLMGLQLVKNSPISNQNKEITVDKTKYQSILSGIVTSVSNPYFFIWWATIGGAFLFKGVGMAGVIGLIGFLIGHWSSDLVWFSAVSFFSSRSTSLMNQNTYKNVMKICGIFLIGVGGYFFMNSWGFI
ncbi:LysE family transporter [Methanobacterium alcaliphilum]|uniref:LysE family transporter n=1 Tax=Methanobacterium alcaliphilum TaxID=392018 RepID=UPI00200A02E4|nr:LysE family transporter [Methanobacterium alcaliphilum]MCK9152352.1 LysE family translocator [Methanobacterium alcaliphilum]